MSYLLQIRAIERQTLTLQAQAPFMENPAGVKTVAAAVAEFDEWLISDPPEDRPVDANDLERQELHEAMGMGRRG